MVGLTVVAISTVIANIGADEVVSPFISVVLVEDT